MAHSKELWLKAKALFEMGYSLDDISLDTNISKGSISKRANKDKWSKNKMKPLKDDIVEWEKENETKTKQKETLVSKLAELSDFNITIMHEKVLEETRLKTLITSTSSLALIRNNQMLTKNKKQSMTKVKTYNSKGQADGETIELYEIDLEPKDVRDIVESTDKASITLNLNQRHANPTNIENTNANQTNIKRVTIARRTDRVK